MENKSITRLVEKTGLGACLLTAAILLGSSVAVAQQAAESGPVANCSDCHGTDGLGHKSGVPHLNGQPEQLLTSMIKAYQADKRPTKVKMHRDIPAADVPLLAKHYSQQKAQRPKSATSAELVAKGETLYANRCADCHVDNGRDSDKEAPLTAGQDLAYLIAQTLAFKAGERKFPYLMDGAYRDLKEEDLTAIAHFFAAQDQVAPQQGKRRRR